MRSTAICGSSSDAGRYGDDRAPGAARRSGRRPRTRRSCCARRSSRRGRDRPAGARARAPSRSGRRPSAAVGSSMITSLEFQSTALAIATDWRCPPESEATGWRIDRTVVTARLVSVSGADGLHRLLVHARCRACARGRGTCSGRCRGCCTSARSWYTVSMPSSAASRGVRIRTGGPSHRISPWSGAWMPAMHLISHRLAGAVVADERRHLAGAHIEVDVGERLHRPEVLGDRRAAAGAAPLRCSLGLVRSGRGSSHASLERRSTRPGPPRSATGVRGGCAC